MFFAPGQDYFKAPYEGLAVYHYEEKSKTKDSYFYSALEHRLASIDENTRREITSRLILKRKAADKEPQRLEEPLPTLLTVFWAVVDADDALPPLQKEEL